MSNQFEIVTCGEVEETKAMLASLEDRGWTVINVVRDCGDYVIFVKKPILEGLVRIRVIRDFKAGEFSYRAGDIVVVSDKALRNRFSYARDSFEEMERVVKDE